MGVVNGSLTRRPEKEKRFSSTRLIFPYFYQHSSSVIATCATIPQHCSSYVIILPTKEREADAERRQLASRYCQLPRRFPGRCESSDTRPLSLAKTPTRIIILLVVFQLTRAIHTKDTLG